MSNFKEMPMPPDQMILFPKSLDESIAQDCDVRIISEAMDRLDWSVFKSAYSHTGCPAYPPKMLTKILVYGYSKGLRSSRAIEDALKNDKRYIWLAGGLEPDHATIARFRKAKEGQLKEIFHQTITLCQEAGLILLNIVAVDGSKIPANASRKSLYSSKRIDKEREAIERIIREAEQADEEDDTDGSGGIPKRLLDAEGRKKVLDEISQRLKESGKKSISATDNECRVMKSRTGLRPCYNLQLSVDSLNSVILAADLVQRENDTRQLKGQLEHLRANVGMSPVMVLADTGYSDEDTYRALDETNQLALIPPVQQPHEKKRTDLFASKCFHRLEDKDALICPAGHELPYYRDVKLSSGTYREYRSFTCRGCTFFGECVTTHCKTGRAVQISSVAERRTAMIETLKRRAGKLLYSLRQQIVEPVFGNIKSNKKMDRFLLDGKSGASSEVWLVCAAHNLQIYGSRA